jgi:cell division protein FtsN
VGVLTVSMTGLRDAIVSSRQARVALVGDLVRQTGERRGRVSTLCAGFARDRAGAHRAWFGPLLFEGQTAERHQQGAKARAPGEEQPPAAPKPEPPSHKPTHKPVAARAAEPFMAPLPRAKKRSSKGLKKD